jgi:glutaconate CoA-transferase subunit B
MPEAGYSIEELLIVALSREIRDGEVTAVGVNSPIPAAACFLAELTHAPRGRMLVLHYPDAAYYPFTGGSKEFFDFVQRGRLDLFFHSGAQIDRDGSINLTAIGDHDRPKLRLPGGMGSAMIYYNARRIVLFRTEHSRRSLVERVDFVTSAGRSSPSVFRRGRPTKLVTTKAVLAFDQERSAVMLESAHPGVEVADIVENTGFALEVPEVVPITAAPSERELLLLRTAARHRVARQYPEFAARAIGTATTTVARPAGG